MSYKVYLPGSLDAVEWSQAVWKVEGGSVREDECEQESVHRILVERLPRDGLIVDAGCGPGRVPMYFQRRGYRILGVEISHEACRIAKRHQNDLKIVEADVRKMPLRAHSVDAVVSLGVVEHNEAGPLEALRETRRILRPNGLLVLTVPYDNVLRRLLVNHVLTYVTRRRRRGGAELRFAEYRFNRREMSSFLEQAGFEVISVRPNDALPPKCVGLWVDYNNLWFDAFPGGEAFVLPGIRGTAGAFLMRWAPWSVCAEVAFVARAK
jgi:SAM-dependent methyltransferase